MQVKSNFASFVILCALVTSVYGQSGTSSNSKPRVAIIDFVERGEVGIKDAGQTVPEMLMARLGPARFQLVERSQLSAILAEQDLTIALVRDNPQRVYGKLKGVNYLILGSVNRLGNIFVSARLVDVATGDVVQTAEVSADDAKGLQDALGRLAIVLQMNEAEKKDYLKTAGSELGGHQVAGVHAEVPKELSLDLGKDVTMKLVLIPAGKFAMGSPHDGGFHQDNKQFRARITKQFYMSAFEVTEEQYKAVMGTLRQSWNKTGNYPVSSVTWNEAVSFCTALSITNDKTVRLPTEAEWEFACRAGTTTPFNTGATLTNSQACISVDPSYRREPLPVGSFQPNAFGLYDMHGNVAEWCSDLYASWTYTTHPAGQEVADPVGPSRTSGDRVSRGGSYMSTATYCQSAHRSWQEPTKALPIRGFRVVVEVGSVK